MSGYDTGFGGSQDPPVGSGYVPAFDGSLTNGTNGTNGSLTTRSSAAPRARDPFDPASVVVDPQIPPAAKQELERRGGPEYGVLASAELVRFMDPPPVAPAPPRSLAAARQLAAAAWALIVVSIVAGVLRGPDAFAILLVLGGCVGVLAAAARGAARKGRPAFAAGLIPLAPARDLSEYYAAHAGKIFHRHYVRPRTDLDQEARGTWERAVDAANRIYRSESLRDEAVDAERVAADVPELLWKIIEGLAMISDVRINIKSIVKGYERQHPAVYAKIQAQERHLARGTSQVESRITKLEMLARVLGDADAARRGEDMLKRLNEVDEKIDDLVASTDETAGEVDMAEGLKIDVEANIEMTNQAIRDLSAQDEDQEPGEAYPPVANAP
jgi:hypothetical protein